MSLGLAKTFGTRSYLVWGGILCFGAIMSSGSPGGGYRHLFSEESWVASRIGYAGDRRGY